MERHQKFVSGEFYHIYNRGVDKQPIFKNKRDWKVFQRLLFLRNDKESNIRVERVDKKRLDEIERGETLVNICAYALMSNHFHLLVQETGEGNISKFMSKLLTSYSMYFNKKYDRSGPVMCRPFRSKHVDDDGYMRWLISYIHLNPLEIKHEESDHDFLMNYQYSSFRDYYNAESENAPILNKEALPIHIGDLEEVNNMFKTQDI